MPINNDICILLHPVFCQSTLADVKSISFILTSRATQLMTSKYLSHSLTTKQVSYLHCASQSSAVALPHTIYLSVATTTFQPSFFLLITKCLCIQLHSFCIRNNPSLSNQLHEMPTWDTANIKLLCRREAIERTRRRRSVRPHILKVHPITHIHLGQ